MNDLTERNFGYLIAYVLPGFVVLWGLRPLSPTIDGWLSTSPSFPAGIESIVFVGLASIAAGMGASALRWLVVDSLHAFTGLRRPEWDDAALHDRLSAFEAIVDAHFRYYEFYANMLVSLPIAFFVATATGHVPSHASGPWWVAFIAVECLLFAALRDSLRKYYGRSLRVLGESPERRSHMTNGHGKPKPKPTKPTTGTPKPSGVRK